MMDKLRRDEKAQGRTARLGLAVIIGLAVLALVGGVLLPIGVNSLEEPTEYTLTQDTGETYNVTSLLDSDVTATTAGTDATVELNDSSGNTVSKTINVDSSKTYNLNDGDVNVTVDEANSGNATVTYGVEQGFGYSGGASSIWNILGLVVVLAAFLFVVGAALDAYRRT